MQSNGNGPDTHAPFNWQVLSELHLLAPKHVLGSPAVTNTLGFITGSELTPFDVRQITKLLCTPVQCVMFEAAWRNFAEKQGLLNSEASQQDHALGQGLLNGAASHRKSPDASLSKSLNTSPGKRVRNVSPSENCKHVCANSKILE